VAERPDTLSHIIHLEKLSLEERAPLVAAVRDDTLALAEVRHLVEQRLHPPVSPKSFLRKNDLAERTPEPALGDAPFLRKNDLAESTPEPALGDAPFLRKNDLAERTPEPALGGAPFLRKNDDAHGSDIPERDIARIRSVVQRWKQLPTPSPEARQQMLTALDGLLGDLEDVMRHLQGQDAEAQS
jgi:hypothetical protein